LKHFTIGIYEWAWKNHRLREFAVVDGVLSMDIFAKQILFVGGKGGVGKSTSAAAIAWQHAKNGYRTLVVSTDSAHNLSDLFARSIGGKITDITGRLQALEIDSDKETDRYMQSVRENIHNVVHPEMMEEVHRQLDTAKASPGAEEAALFDKLISIILEERKHFDRLVFETAPTGHTIRLLSLPELLGVWIEGLLGKRQKTNENYSRLLHDGEPVEDPIYDVLRQRQARLAKARELLLDSNQTEFVFVLNPERLSILETEKAIGLLEQYRMQVTSLIINRVLPDDVDGAFFQERKRQEAAYLDLINQ